VTRRRFQTPLCDLLGIEQPILQSGMGRIAGPDLVAQVSRAGGLGILAGLLTPAEELKRQIALVRAATDRPFGVNLWLHEAMQPPASIAGLDARALDAAQRVLDGFRERLGVPRASAPPAPVPDLIDAAFEVILEERVPVFSVGLGNPGRDRTARCHERGIKVIAMAATVADARALAASGVDAIVAQGGEAGGHRSTWVKPGSANAASIGAMALVPQVVDAVDVPVIAAGGIADGRGLVAALCLGAQAVMLGTRFVATRESLAPAFFKQAVLERDSDATLVTDAFTGLYARALRNRFATEYEASGAPVLPPLVQTNAAQDVYVAALTKGDAEHYPMLAGQSCGLIADLPSAADVVSAVMAEAERVRV
jgi:nitronate monooxygenase